VYKDPNKWEGVWAFKIQKIHALKRVRSDFAGYKVPRFGGLGGNMEEFICSLP
jgi:hypothetical protein